MVLMKVVCLVYLMDVTMVEMMVEYLAVLSAVMLVY